MKKNAIGHMVAPKETAGSRIRRWNIIPRLVCLLLAVFLWLIIVNVKNSRDVETDMDLPLTETNAVQEE